MAIQARQRRRELQKVRALLTYQEQKYRREKRIKSKRWVLNRSDVVTMEIVQVSQDTT